MRSVGRLVRSILIVSAVVVPSAASTKARTPSNDIVATIERSGRGEWTLSYRLDDPAPALLFMRTHPTMDDKDWRVASWTVVSPNAKLQRVGQFDVLTSTNGKPLSKVRLKIVPFGEHLKADYVSFLKFSDGGLAIYSDHYLVAPIKSPEDANTFVPEQAKLPLEDLIVKAPGQRLLLAGKQVAGSAKVRMGEGAYIYTGNVPVTNLPAVSAVIDTQLPQWFRTELSDFTPKLFRLYTDRLGAPGQTHPVTYVAWGGPVGSGTSMGGSVLKGTIVLEVHGQGAVNPSAATLTGARWFLGHESAHFWLGQLVHYDTPAEAWITEGSADLMAIRALEALTPGYDARKQLQKSLTECLKVNGPGLALIGASARNDVRANYTCGAMLLLAAEAAARRKNPSADAFAWLKSLIEGSKADGVLTEARWLQLFETTTGDPALTASVREYLDKGVDDPRAFFAHLFTAVGVKFDDGGGVLKLT